MDEKKREAIEDIIDGVTIHRNRPEFWTACVVRLLQAETSLRTCADYFGWLSRSGRISIKWEYLYKEDLVKDLPDRSLIQDYADHPASDDRLNDPESFLGNILWVWVLMNLPHKSGTENITQKLIEGRDILVPHKEVR